MNIKVLAHFTQEGFLAVENNFFEKLATVFINMFCTEPLLHSVGFSFTLSEATFRDLNSTE